MYSISISHKTAPVQIRELLAFSKEEQVQFVKSVVQNKHIYECVLISTCNRSEVYFSGDELAVSIMEKYLAEYKEVDLEKVLKHYRIYSEDKAILHLFRVTCGLDSMLIGEDEILGQIKEAYGLALKAGATGFILNTLFQGAITCAKKIKTITRLSKTPVSIGTLVANEVFRFSKTHKKVLIIGITGSMGTIIAKNICGKSNIEIIGTSRTHSNFLGLNINNSNIKVIDYKDRYEYINDVDIIISVTTSPHYTITHDKLVSSIKKEKKRLLIDLSVPHDIDKEIKKIDNLELYDIDYFEELSKNNNGLKFKEIEYAELIIQEQIDDVLKELTFHNYLDDISRMKQLFEEKTFEHIIYSIKNNASSKELEMMLKAFKKLI